VRVRVAAATVNPADTLFRGGGLAAAVATARPPYVAGLEFAGTIDAAGPDAGWEPGAAVMGITAFIPNGRGAHAEQVVVDARSVTDIPKGATMAEAATLPMNGLTARLALDRLGLSPGQTLAVTGAAGAVGATSFSWPRTRGSTSSPFPRKTTKTSSAGSGRTNSSRVERNPRRRCVS
jgi:NADPH:quinone reductase